MNHAKFFAAGFIAVTSALAQGGEMNFSVASGFFEENPGGKALGPCHGGVVIDKAGNIYVTTDTERGIVVFSAEGKFMRSVGPTRVHGSEIGAEGGRVCIYGARPLEHEVVNLTR